MRLERPRAPSPFLCLAGWLASAMGCAPGPPNSGAAWGWPRYAGDSNSLTSPRAGMARGDYGNYGAAQQDPGGGAPQEPASGPTAVYSSMDRDPTENPPGAPEPEGVPGLLARSALRLGLSLYDSSSKAQGNFSISPYDMLRVLAMADAGANHECALEIQRSLRLPSDSQQLFHGLRNLVETLMLGDGLSGSNAVVVAEDKGLSAEAKQKIADSFGTSLQREALPDLAHGAQSFVQGRGSDDLETQMPPEAWAQLSLQTSQLALLGVTSFVSHWDGDPTRHSQNMRFRDGRSRSVRTIGSRGPVLTYETERYRAVQPLLGKSSRFGLLILVPKGSTSTEKAPSVVEVLSIVAGLKPQPPSIDVPAFSVATAANFVKSAQTLGMRALFDKSRGELTHLGAVGQGLYAHELLHGMMLRVDEGGMKAHAYTALKFNNGEPQPEANARKNRLQTPFFYILRDLKWGLPIAMGRIDTPL